MKCSLSVHIVGGGMTGLTLAYKLARRGVAVVVHERDPYLGGLAAEGNLGGVPVERYYHCVLPTDSALLHLFGELSFSDQVGWTKTRTGFFHERQLLEMTSAADFARFPAITRIDRLRLAWTIAYCGYVANWKTLDREPISTFLRRHGGERLFRSIWEPLLMAKLGQDYDPTDKVTAQRVLQETRQRGEFATGLLYFEPGRPDVLSLLNVVDEPLASLSADRVRPSRAALGEIMESLK